MVQKYSVSRLGRDFKLSDHFSLGEMASHDGSDEVLIDSDLIAALEVLRKVVQRPVRISSGYRSPEHNKKIGGVPDSQHTKGRAADVQVQGFAPAQIAKIVEDISLISAIGIYNTFVHIDTRPRKPDGSRYRWNG